MKVVIVGGVAGGATAAARIRRLNEQAVNWDWCSEKIRQAGRPVKVLRSPHAHAIIQDIQTTAACKVPGIEAIYTWKDVPNHRFTTAGQTYPEPSAHDRLILDQRVRFVGDAVAIVAGETEKAVNKALKMIKVTYEVLEPVLDFRAVRRDALRLPEFWRWIRK